jgi:dihydrofolate reductase
MTNNLILIAAVADNGVIGLDNKLPWSRIEGDLPRFKRLTTGHAVVMGSRTYESFGRRPLPDRLNLIVTRQQDFATGGLFDNLNIGDLEAQLERASRYRPEQPVFIIGGGEIYRQTIDLPQATRLEITRVHQSPQGDTYFPSIDARKWAMVKGECHQDKGYTFETWEKVG